MKPAERRLGTGGRIDRERPIAFAFNGRAMTGYRGDTLAAALLANGVRLIGRSFKYHRPRGIFTAGPEEPNALLTLGSGGRRDPNVAATTVELVGGLEAASQNHWPSLALDVRAITGIFAPVLAAGFYYKTFMGPTHGAWMTYERFIRRAAGLGRATEDADPDRYEVRHGFVEVAVVGGGPAGLSGARAAAHAGASVALIEQDFLLGGSVLREPVGTAAAGWRSEMVAELERLPNIRILARTTAFGIYDGNTIGLIERRDHLRPDPGKGEPRQVMRMLRARAIVFATGALEQPLVFADNDRPGVMLASAARTYLNRFAVLAGRRVTFATQNDSGYRAAFDFARNGAAVTVADLRPDPPANVLAEASRHGVAVLPGASIAAVRGRSAVRSVRLAGPGGALEVACDLLGVSGGWSPTVHLTSHLGEKPQYREDIRAFVPGHFRAGQFGAGAVMGSFAMRQAIEEGHLAGVRAAGFCERNAPVPAAREVDTSEAISPAAPAIAMPDRGKAFVDLQNDVTADDIRLAHREGYRSIEHLKRYTTAGMGTDQGKTSNLNSLRQMADLRGVGIPEVGTTTFRPPYTPVSIGAFAGRSVGHHFRPLRRTPMHDWHLENGAEMVEVGLWQRPWFYRSAGRDLDEAYVAEMRAVRDAAGIVDISTLGKIEIEGPDAAVFIDRVYANGFASLAVGRARYGVMLRDDGIVLDDGTVTRLEDHRFFVTTSTAKAAEIMSWLEFLLEIAWPELRAAVASVSDEWAAMSVAGPRSRDSLAAAFPELDVSNSALPHMGLLEAVHEGQPLRILRISYSGERAYEIYAGARHGRAIWERLMRNGAPFGLKAYGVEALGALRVEKGHVAGPEIDGRTTLEDLGLERLARKDRAFIGSVLRHRSAFRDPARPRLVGLQCLEPDARLRGGAALFAPEDPITGHGRGRVTSVTYSPTLGHYIALGLYSGGMECAGREVIAVHPIKGEIVRARIVSPAFLDPKGERLRG